MLNLAVGQLCSLPDTQIVDMSSFYESEPAYYEDQDAFVNAVVLLRSGAAAQRAFGVLAQPSRTASAACAPLRTARARSISIFVDYQMYVASDDEALTLPHPRVTERDFVVKPVLELPARLGAGGWIRGRVPEAERVGKARRI